MKLKKYKRLITSLALFSLLPASLSTISMLSSCKEKASYTIKGDSNISITRGESGSKQYEFFDNTSRTNVDSSLVKWSFSDKDTPPPKTFNLIDGVLSWNSDIIVADHKTFTIVGSYNNVSASMTVVICVEHSELYVNMPSIIYAYKDSRNLGASQSIYVFDSITKEAVDWNNLEWKISGKSGISSALKINDDGTLELTHDLSPDNYLLQLVISTKDGKKSTGDTPISFTLIVYNVSTSFFVSESIDQYSASISLNYSYINTLQSGNLPNSLVIPEVSTDGKIIVQIADFSLKNINFNGSDITWTISDIVFPKNLKKIGNNFLADKTDKVKLSSLDLSSLAELENLYSIGNNFLANATDYSINSITLPSSLQLLGNAFLSNCACDESSTLETNKVDLSNTAVSTISSDFMYGCKGWSGQIVFPKNLNRIQNNFMYGCTLFNASIILPDNLVAIGDNFLGCCDSFDSDLTINNNLNSIGNYFLTNCKSFNKSLTITKNVTHVGSGFMFCCDNMTSLVNILNDYSAFSFDSLSDRSFATINKNAVCYIQGIKINRIVSDFFEKVFDQNGYTYYRKVICDDVSYLKFQTTTPDDYYSVSSDGASLTEKINIILPAQQLIGSTYKKAGEINDNFFISSSYVNSVFLQPSILRIGANFLAKNPDFNHEIILTKMINLSAIGSGFLSECSKFNQSLDLSKTSVTTINDDFLKMGSSTEFNSNVILPLRLTNIGNNFMNGCNKFEQSISIPETVQTIGSNFFANASSLKSITFEGKVKTLPTDAFTNCKGITVYANKDDVSSYTTLLDTAIKQGWVKNVQEKQ